MVKILFLYQNNKMKCDVIIAGAGIVGLATALKIKEKKPHLRVRVFEKEARAAQHQTGNNSGVIHSGIYYKPGSLKATNCINGYHLLLDFAQKHEIPFELCGKIIVATKAAQLTAMHNVLERGKANGLGGLKQLSAAELKEYEPNVNGVAGIFVPQTGIIDYKVVTQKYADLFLELGGEIVYNKAVTGIRTQQQNIWVNTDDQETACRLFINCGGLFSDRIARYTENGLNVRIIPFRGEYYKITEAKKKLVNNLIYPVPDPNFPFLGVHFTRMIDGAVEAGPNAVFAFKREGYKKTDFSLTDFSESIAWKGFRKVALKYWKTGLGEFYRSFSKRAFTKALQELVPAIEEKDLYPAGAGVRAQACSRDGGLIDDFMFVEKEGIIHVLNAPSPAATSSLSIGDTVAQKAIAYLG